ncbi:hypothetical protein D3C78_1993970 [compost metagenome]
MLQRIGIQLGEHTVERAALSPQPVNLKQQLQQIGQRIETFEGRGAELKTR